MFVRSTLRCDFLSQALLERSIGFPPNFVFKKTSPLRLCSYRTIRGFQMSLVKLPNSIMARICSVIRIVDQMSLSETCSILNKQVKEVSDLVFFTEQLSDGVWNAVDFQKATTCFEKAIASRELVVVRRTILRYKHLHSSVAFNTVARTGDWTYCEEIQELFREMRGENEGETQDALLSFMGGALQFSAISQFEKYRNKLPLEALKRRGAFLAIYAAKSLNLSVIDHIWPLISADSSALRQLANELCTLGNLQFLKSVLAKGILEPDMLSMTSATKSEHPNAIEMIQYIHKELNISFSGIV